MDYEDVIKPRGFFQIFFIFFFFFAFFLVPKHDKVSRNLIRSLTWFSRLHQIDLIWFNKVPNYVNIRRTLYRLLCKNIIYKKQSLIYQCDETRMKLPDKAKIRRWVALFKFSFKQFGKISFCKQLGSFITLREFE